MCRFRARRLGKVNLVSDIAMPGSRHSHGLPRQQLKLELLGTGRSVLRERGNIFCVGSGAPLPLCCMRLRRFVTEVWSSAGPSELQSCQGLSQSHVLSLLFVGCSTASCAMFSFAAAACGTGLVRSWDRCAECFRIFPFVEFCMLKTQRLRRQ